MLLLIITTLLQLILYVLIIIRNMGYGTTLLQGIEKCIKNEYNIKNIKLLAWQAQGSTEVVDFFKKNGYNESDNDNINTYDDYDKIYELIKFNKRI